MNVKTEQGKALKHAYNFARAGNGVWCQLWIDRANSFLAVSKKQLAYAQKLYDKARKEKEYAKEND
jgi:ribosomal protein L20